MNSKPLVSIIIPVYNGSNFMKAAIDSALSQTYENIEVLVINDGSCDDGETDKIARSYGDKIRYIFKENGGVSTALNLGIKEMKGEYFSWLSHDDVYDVRKVESQIEDVSKLKAEGEDVTKYMFYCLSSLMNANGQIIRNADTAYKSGKYPSNEALNIMFKGNMLGGCGLLIPKEMFETVGTFHEDMRYMQDVFMWEKALIAGYNLYVNEARLVNTRIHNKQVSVTGKSYGEKDRETVGKYLAEHLKGLKTADGQSVLKTYLFLCMRNNSVNIGNMIYKDLLKNNELSLSERFKINLLKIYGQLRKRLSKIYYAILYCSGR